MILKHLDSILIAAEIRCVVHSSVTIVSGVQMHSNLQQQAHLQHQHQQLQHQQAHMALMHHQGSVHATPTPMTHVDSASPLSQARLRPSSLTT